MNQLFWIFALMLMIITISGSFNNALNVHENFLEEVLEMNEDTNEPVQGYDYYPLLANLKSECTDEEVFEEEEEVVVPKEVIVQPPPSIEKVPIQMSRPQPVVRKEVKSVPQTISGYDSQQFLAPF